MSDSLITKKYSKKFNTGSLIFNYIDSCVDIHDIEDYSDKLYCLKIKDIFKILKLARKKSNILFQELLELEVREIPNLCDCERDLYMQELIEDERENYLSY